MRKVNNWLPCVLVIWIALGTAAYYTFFHTPKDSLGLYQAISFADDFEKAVSLTLEGYEENFKIEDYEFINSLENQAQSVSQYTLFEYKKRTYLIMTTPGTDKLEVLDVRELPEEIRNYFLEINP
jgi:hypothetical protein